MKKHIQFIINILIAVTILTGIGLIYSQTKHSLSEHDKAYIGNYKAVIVVSGSMEPAIMTDSLNLAEKVDNIDDIEVGDIVMFNTSIGVVSHRCIEKETYNGKTYLHTKGDNNNEADGILVDEEMIEGKIVYTINSIAPLIKYLNTDGNTVATMYKLVMIILIVIVVIDYARHPIEKYIKAIYFTYNPEKFEINELPVIDRLETYKEQLNKINKQLKSDKKHKISYTYHLGKALESIDDIVEDLDDLEKRINKMNS